MMKSFFRYNLTILLGNTVWLLVVPITTSQLIVVWNMAVRNLFDTSVAARATETLAPLWAALLCAHLLGQEYRSQLAEITFARPVPIHRVVHLRLAVIFGFIGILALSTLVSFSLLIGTFDFLGVLVAGIPPCLFLGMLALCLSTVWRNPLMGFGVAALYWAVDLLIGIELNPLLCLYSFSSSSSVNPLAAHWRVNKMVLLACALVLYVVHGRIVGRPQGLPGWRTRLKAGSLPVAIVLGALLSGATYKMVLGRQYEAQFPDKAWRWYFEQFRVYQPLPVAWIFGPAFAHYTGAPLPGMTVRNEFRDQPAHLGLRMTRWKAIADRQPNSRWAPFALFELARNCELTEPQDSAMASRYLNAQVSRPQTYRLRAIAYYDAVAQRYPNSRLAPVALSRLDALARDLGRDLQAIRAERQLLAKYPQHPATWPAAERLANHLEREGKLDEILPDLRKVAERAIETIKPVAQVFLAGKLAARGQREEARKLYEQARTTAQQGIRYVQANFPSYTPGERKRILQQLDGILKESEAALKGWE